MVKDYNEVYYVKVLPSNLIIGAFHTLKEAQRHIITRCLYAVVSIDLLPLTLWNCDYYN